MHDHFGVAARAEGMTQCRQFGNERLEVVDLAVEHDDDRAVFVGQRLLAARDVDDGQAAVAEPDTGLDVQVAFVRAAVMLRLVHAVQYVARNVATVARVENANETAHAGRSDQVVSASGRCCVPDSVR